MNTTRKYARTMSQAFGPYEGSGLYTKPEPLHKHDRIVLAGSAVAFVFVFVLMVVL
jgi:hypothetical protein